MGNKISISRVVRRYPLYRHVVYFLFGIVICIGSLATAYATGSVTPGDEVAGLYTVSKTLAPLGTNPVGGHIDLDSGQLSIRQVDVSIPGNSDLPVEFARTFIPDGHFSPEAPETNLGELRDWRIDVPKIYTLLADPAMSGVAEGWSNDRCSNFKAPPQADASRGTKGGAGTYPFAPSEYWHGYHVHIPGKGTHELLTRWNNVLTPGDPAEFPIVTNNYWAVGCKAINGVDANQDPDSTTGEAFILHTPDGRTYYFDHMTREPQSALRHEHDHHYGYILFRWRYIMFASRVVDAFGNWVKYKYDSSGKLTAIQANDGRLITIHYNGDGKVSSVTANNRTWIYTYNTDAAGSYHLDSVTLPDGRQWHFALSGIMDDALDVQNGLACHGTSPGPASESASGVGSITSPYGVTVKFTLDAARMGRADLPASNCAFDNFDLTWTTTKPDEYFTLAVTKKTISGPNMAPLTWTYEYSHTPGWYSDETPGAIHRWTEVHDPDGGKVRYWFDMRADGLDGWREGNLD